MKWYNPDFWVWLVWSAIGSLVLLGMFASCKSKQYVTVPEYHTEYITRIDTFNKVDSIYMKDSVYVYQNGDTVTINKTTYRDRWHNIYKVKLDTIIKRDSIRVPYPVSRELSMKDKIVLKALTYTAFILVIGVIVCVFIWLFYWYRNKTC